MSEGEDWQIPAGMRPDADSLGFDIDRALAAIVSIRARIPEDAFTASTLGRERGGNGVIIERGIVLTIGYLITEADQVWITGSDGRAVPGTVVGYDQETGFGLVQALGRLDLPELAIGDLSGCAPGAPLVVAGQGGLARALRAKVVAIEEFAGYWEYLLERALFTAPAYPNWSGAAALDRDGRLVGIGSLHVERSGSSGRAQEVNMFVPCELLEPIRNDLLTLGRPAHPPRPWLGVFTVDHEGKLVVAGLAGRGPAHAAGIRTGDTIVAIDGDPTSTLPAFYRRLWAIGPAGSDVTLTILRDERQRDVTVATGDRNRFLKRPQMH